MLLMLQVDPEASNSSRYSHSYMLRPSSLICRPRAHLQTRTWSASLVALQGSELCFPRIGTRLPLKLPALGFKHGLLVHFIPPETPRWPAHQRSQLQCTHSEILSGRRSQHSPNNIVSYKSCYRSETEPAIREYCPFECLMQASSSLGSVLGRGTTYEEGILGSMLGIQHIYTFRKWQLVGRVSSKAHLGSFKTR